MVGAMAEGSTQAIECGLVDQIKRFGQPALNRRVVTAAEGSTYLQKRGFGELSAKTVGNGAPACVYPPSARSGQYIDRDPEMIGDGNSDFFDREGGRDRGGARFVETVDTHQISPAKM
ncbi:hypothetical protein BOO69_09570 [Sulfitobacter alexandrii]|uniref:Uncharacterized protein n=1 Tax=Sulfitobacter alexandrii TaxID=1917485 RepID=A0A1J0WH53_9RHOB|nr:hypothetical protein [Sulfitobacter alexandrii]APE43635.1 hypothetical protein BOO69_09570 [Sulfitobacter alexandrii]